MTTRLVTLPDNVVCRECSCLASRGCFSIHGMITNWARVVTSRSLPFFEAKDKTGNFTNGKVPS